MIDSPHQHAQRGVTGSEDFHFLLHKMLLLGLPFGLQGAQMDGGGSWRGHSTFSGIRASVCEQVICGCLYVKCARVLLWSLCRSSSCAPARTSPEAFGC